MKISTINHFKTKQAVLPLYISDYLDICDPVLVFDRFMEGIDLEKYLKNVPEHITGRIRYNPTNMLKAILFGFMSNGYISLRELEDNCKVNLRYMYLMEHQTPSYRTFGYFIENILAPSVEELFRDINQKIFTEEHVDLNHLYIDGSKFEANANKYSWVWKKATEKFRYKLYEKITVLFHAINEELAPFGIKIETNTEYVPAYLKEVIKRYSGIYEIDESKFVHGIGHRKTPQQRHYERLQEYTTKLEEYVERIAVCGPNRNSYSKTDHSATFMRIKKDYMGNDQLLPAYNVQFGIADEYIAVADVNSYRSDMDCFIPLLEQFHETYGFYPKYPVADAGYGSYNNYIYCEQHGMEKYMKFPMFKKETTDAKYRDNPFRAVNFKIDADGLLRCPAGQAFHLQYRQNVKEISMVVRKKSTNVKTVRVALMHHSAKRRTRIEQFA